ncbi:MAG: hypothetical protein VX225_04905 [Pseudomonadota bacterium]|nr:hypothetical protein [Pseudomonadota bacterium]
MRFMFLLAVLIFEFNLPNEADAESAHFNYILHCQGCHLASGGETLGKIPALIGVGRFLLVKGGREFLVQVPGVSGSIVNDAELASILNWMLHEFSSGNLPRDFEPYGAEEVGEYRKNPLVDVESVREQLLSLMET